MENNDDYEPDELDNEELAGVAYVCLWLVLSMTVLAAIVRLILLAW